VEPGRGTKKEKVDVHLVAADQALDRQIIRENFKGITAHFLRTGKIRRYLSWRNLTDPFAIVAGIIRAYRLLRKIRPDVIFFKGGFVGFPILIAARILKASEATIYTHESDISIGAMARFASRFAVRTFASFDGWPLFYSPVSESSARKKKSPLPHLLIMGGSQGAEYINRSFELCHTELLKSLDVRIITGKEKKLKLTHPHLEQHEFVPAQKLSEMMEEADVVVSRGGSNSLFEILSAKKPGIIIPLPSVARNHQWHNAKYFEKKGLCTVVRQEKKPLENLAETVQKALKNKSLHEKLVKANIKNKAHEIAQIIVSEYNPST